MKNFNLLRWIIITVIGFCGGVARLQADPQLTSWLTSYSGEYARVYETNAEKLSGTSLTTWPSAGRTGVSGGQSLPTYVGVHEIDTSGSWVYVKTTGFACHIMGPWYSDSAQTTLFNNMPSNQDMIYRIPRTPVVSSTKTLTPGGAIGIFVDGVAMFDERDTFSVVNSSGSESPMGLGIWNRDAYVNEYPSFDPGYAHQPPSGEYHYHVDPLALRYQMGDNVLFSSTTGAYSENTANTTPSHSPLLGWVADGYPIYGPYGYSSAMDSTSAVTRMRSGFVLRSGSYGTTNLASTGRKTLPAWAQRAQGRTTLTSAQYGPNVSTSYPLGRYLEDNDYLGDHGYTLGTDFDLNEYNCRYCVTPEFPGGTYAYFVCINSSGTPVFPYDIGRDYYGSPAGGSVTSITETVTDIFQGGPNAALNVALPAHNNTTGDITISWSSTEGGTYTVGTSPDLLNWTTTSLSAAVGVTTSVIDPAAAKTYTSRFYKVTRTALATYDSTGF